MDASQVVTCKALSLASWRTIRRGIIYDGVPLRFYKTKKIKGLGLCPLFQNEMNKRTMTDEDKNKLVDEVMQGFDFEKVRSLVYIEGNPLRVRLTIDEMKETAERILRMALEHQDREFWWAGGMHRGGLCACYDDKWGLSLNYIAVAKKVRIPKE